MTSLPQKGLNWLQENWVSSETNQIWSSLLNGGKVNMHAHTHIYLGQRGFLRCLHFLLERLTAYSSPLLFISCLCVLREKAWTSLEWNWSSLRPGPAEPSPSANASCDHLELRSCSLVQTNASLYLCGWVHSQWCCHQSFYAASFPWLLGVCSLSALHHHCTVHNNYFGSCFQFELFFPLYMGWGLFFLFN